MSKYSEVVGIIGVTNALLFVICACRQLFRLRSVKVAPDVYRRKLSLFLLLAMVGAVEIPMYIGYLLRPGFEKSTYAIHKTGNAFFLMSLGVVMDEWCSVLYNNPRLLARPWYLRKTSLIVGVSLAVIIVLADIYVVMRVNSFADFYTNPGYQISLMLSFVCILTFAALTLCTGLTLSKKITSLIQRDTPTSGPSHLEQDSLGAAAKKLVICMSMLMVCMATQAVVLMQSYYTSFRPSSSDTLMVVLLFWMLWNWLPLWGGPGILLLVSGIPSGSRSGPEQSSTVDSRYRSDLALLYESGYTHSTSIPSNSMEAIEKSFGSVDPTLVMQPRSVSTHGSMGSRPKEGSYYSRYSSVTRSSESESVSGGRLLST